MASHGRLVSLAALLVLGASASIAQVPTPNGGEFLVNTYTMAEQGVPEVAVDGSGHFIVVWDGFGPGDTDNGIFARRYASSGYPLGPAFRVNTYTTEYQVFPSVAADAEGNFVVAWQSFGSSGDPAGDADGYGIRARRISATDVDGTASPIDFAVNTFTTGWQYLPHVAMNAAGQFVVVWQGDYQDGDYYGILGRRYDNTGSPLGAEFTVNSYFTGKQYEPEVGLAADGRFVVAWEGEGSGDDLGIFGRRFDAAGSPVGLDFQVNDVTYDYQTRPSLSVAADSSFVVAWQSFTTAGYDVLARPFNPSAAPITASFLVNQYTTSAQFAPSAALDAAGNFLVTWSTVDSTRDGSGYSVLARRFNAAGAPTSTEFRVNSYTSGNQAFSNVAATGPQDFLVAWESASGVGDNDTGVYAQRYGDLIFSDKVDSGSLLFWSSSQTDGGDLSVQPTAALASSAFGIQSVIDDTAGLFVQDDTPNEENRYRARFYVDPNGFDPGRPPWSGASASSWASRTRPSAGCSPSCCAARTASTG